MVLKSGIHFLSGARRPAPDDRSIPFTKMHGAGNDFVVIDNRGGRYAIGSSEARRIADRRFGIGCDQVVVMESPAHASSAKGGDAAQVRMRIINADGGEVEACGNASRCVAWLLMREKKSTTLSIETLAGVVRCSAAGDDRVTVDMGAPKLYWQDIPLATACDTLSVPVESGEFKTAVAVSMGNPHAVFFVDDLSHIALEEIGPALEHHDMFPERANIGMAQVVNSEHINLRVWERGTGETLACGTGACAALVAASRQGLTGRKASVSLPGGELKIEWQGVGDDGHVRMTGPVAVVFKGEIAL